MGGACAHGGMGGEDMYLEGFDSETWNKQATWGLFDRASSSWNKVKCQLDATR